MNITESNHVVALLRALQGDPDIEPERVAEAALALAHRVHDTLHASPAVDEALVLTSTVMLQVQIGGPNFDGALDEDPLDARIASEIGAGRITLAGTEEGIAQQEADGKVEAAARRAAMSPDGQSAYDTRVKGQRKTVDA